MSKKLRLDNLSLKSADQSSRSVINDELVRGLRQLLRKQVRSKEDLDDILQEVMLKILKSGHKVSPAKLINWIAVVSRTTAIDFYRKRKRTIALSDEHLTEAALVEASAQQETSAELARCVQPMFKVLPSEDAQILTMVEISGMSQIEAAQKMHLRYSTFKSKLQRARLKLKKELLACCKQETVKTRQENSDCCGCGSSSDRVSSSHRGHGNDCD